jgi:hypothetical protein
MSAERRRLAAAVRIFVLIFYVRGIVLAALTGSGDDVSLGRSRWVAPDRIERREAMGP